MELLSIATPLTVLVLALLYRSIGTDRIMQCLKLMLTEKYWQPRYNKIEAASWFAKACIIFPGLIFDTQIWWLYLFSFTTSSLLIWASMKKLLPALLIFNSLWIFISVLAIVKHVIGQTT